MTKAIDYAQLLADLEVLGDAKKLTRDERDIIDAAWRAIKRFDADRKLAIIAAAAKLAKGNG